MVGLARLGAQPVRPVRHHDPRNAEPLDWRGVPEGRPDHQRRLLLQGQLGNERGQVGRHVRHGGTPRRVGRWLPCLAPQPTIALTGVSWSTSFRTKPQTRSRTARNPSISPHKAADVRTRLPRHCPDAAFDAEAGLGEPAADRSTRWWARFAGAVAGLVGLAVADLADWLIAPTSSVVPAVGELIIGLLPASLVNWGKDTLGTADKPVLLIMIFAGVLILAGLAGQLEVHRRYAGAPIFVGLAVIAVVALAAAADVQVRGYLTVLIGLFLGYLALRAMINRLRNWRTKSGAHGGDAMNAETTGRRRLLGLTLLLGAAATVTAVASRVLLNAAGAVSEARSRFPLPRATKAAEPVPPGADLDVRGLSP